MAALQLITLNCQGLRKLDNRDTLFSWLNCCTVNVVCLQETHSLSEREFSAWLSFATAHGQNKHNFRCLSSPGTNRSSGVALLYGPEVELVHSFRDNNGRFVGAEFSLHNYSFRVCTIYAPNSQADGVRFFESLYSVLDSITPTILCGDFNTVPDAIRDRRGCSPSSPWAYNWSPTLQRLVATFDLHDVWRLHHPHETSFTWHRPNGQQASRLDMYWLSAFFLGMVTAVDICPFFRSDHSCVFLELHLPSSVHRGRGPWKLNTNHLKDPVFIRLIREFWRSWQQEKGSFLSLSAWWDAGKARLRDHCRRYSRSAALTSRRNLQSLHCTLTHLQRRQDSGENVTSLLHDTKTNLEEAYRLQARGARIRAQVQWAEEGESSNAYFLRLEKKKGQNRLIYSVRTFSGVIVTSFCAIMSAWVTFYASLFTSQCLVDTEQRFFLDQLHFKLSDLEQGLCEGLLTNGECKRAVDAMASGKSPGIDGLPAEFYKTFWDLLGDDLTEVMNFSYHRGQLSASQRSGVITLLHKKGDRLAMKNWRPITLLCVDYKIAAKAIANRLLQVIGKVTHSAQTCGVPGRSSTEGVRSLKDILLHANENGIGGAVISLDQEKAFDRVEWSYLQRVLRAMNFGDSFCAWVSLFYSNIHSCVLVNGELSELFSVSRGVRQGCPLSPLLYVLVAETIAAAIRNDHFISGYILPTGDRLKVCQYADDTSVIVTSDLGISSLFHLFARYETASGAKLNVAKSSGLLFGSWKTRDHHVVPLDWSPEGITVLGAYLSNSGEELWAGKVNSVTSSCASWSKRSLSFHGRALIVNSLVLSQLWYLGANALMPPTVLKDINSVVFDFLWSGKREWLARSSVTQKPCRGGLGVVDIRRKLASLHSLWVKRLLVPPHLPWTGFFQQYLRRAFPGRSLQQILLLPHPPQYAMDALPPFYRSVMAAWFSLERGFTDGEYIVFGPKQRLSKLSELSAKFVYSALSSIQCTKHRCIDRYQRWNLTVDWPTVWINLHLWRFVRPVRDTSWLVAHGILPTADRLLRFGMNVDPLCDCGQPETLQHLFVECSFAKRILHWYSALLRRFNPKYLPLTAAVILVGYGKAPDLPPVFSCILGIIRHQLWLSRNKARFDRVTREPHRVLRRITSSVRQVVTLQRRHCPSAAFAHLWLADGTVGKVIHNVVVFSDDFS